jgi:hypothetical protein
MIFWSVMPLKFLEILPPPCSIFNNILVKVKDAGKGHSRRGHKNSEGRKRQSSTLSLTLALDGVGGQCHTLAVLPHGMTQQPSYRKLDGPQGLSGQVQKILPPLGLDPQTVQPIASHYTNYAIPAHSTTSRHKNNPKQ